MPDLNKTRWHGMTYLSLALMTIFLFPVALAAEKGKLYFLKYIGSLLLMYLPILTAATFTKIMLLKSRYEVKGKKWLDLSIQVLAENIVELAFLLACFHFLGEFITSGILTKIDAAVEVIKDRETVKTFLILLVLFPLHWLLSIFFNLIMLQTLFATGEKISKRARVAAWLAPIFPAILLLFILVGGIILKYGFHLL